MTTLNPSTQPKSQSPICNPRRLLILSPTSHSAATIPSLLHALTGAEAPPPSFFAGYTTHPPFQIKNRYYTAEVPIWVDEIAISEERAIEKQSTALESESTETKTNKTQEDSDSDHPVATPLQWKSEFSGPAAQVVRDAIGAVVICIVNPTRSSDPDADVDADERQDVRDIKEFIHAVGDVRALIEEERGGIGDVPGLVVFVGKGQSQSPSPGPSQNQNQNHDAGVDDADIGVEGEDEPFSVLWWEDRIYEMGMVGMEVVSWYPKGVENDERNQFGEYQGIRRIREVLETHDWAPPASEDVGSENDEVDDDIERMLLKTDEENGFDLEVNELEREMVGLRFAFGRGVHEAEDSEEEGDQELRVDAVEALLSRMAAIRDMNDELPEAERKRFAAKAVRDIMKEI
ncbi:hypothetical protein EYZ11_012765 [Aspergillus tanneri]|uniref:Increased recombination centers protein 6 n=1 Tax=Aspergillus tanneri TaxID=1220188 RepID=A0A4S3J1J0_9EURO|nr:uncharacterized protein ATNIH1004_004687 [Aspergillus tanneri]KAA8648802.1 hypothetical protein ATNIH1004_004687 [Aspergillus tanneri]THC87788.1 hypothetical protein EYZ11_012765 [Aspergillus tanneri]